MLSFLNHALAAGKKATEPVVVPVAQVGNTHLVGIFSTLQEYRDFITIVLGVLIFSFREWYQYRKDRERLGEIEAGQKLATDNFLKMERQQTIMLERLDAFIRASEKADDRIENRIDRLEARVNR